MSDSPPADKATWEGWFSATTEPADDSSGEADPVASAPFVPSGDGAPPVDADAPLDPLAASSAPPEQVSPGSVGRLRALIDVPRQWARSWTWPHRHGRTGSSNQDEDTLAATSRRRWPRPNLLTYLLVSLFVVLGVVVAVLYEIRPDAQASVRSACTRGIASTGAVVHTATLRSVQGSSGKWTVGVQATDGSGTRQWICHVVWDGSHATILTALPGAQ